MGTFTVVVVLETGEFSSQLPRILKRHVIEILAPDRADQSFYIRVRHRYIGHGLDSSDFEDTKIGFPAVKLEQRVII